MKNYQLFLSRLGTTFLCALVSTATLAVFLPFKNNKSNSQAMSVTTVPGQGGTIVSNQQRTMQQMNYSELQARKEYWKNEGYEDRVVLYLRQMLVRCDDLSDRADLLLELADTLFSLQNFTEAHVQYEEFALLFQGHEKVSYAQYQLILCCKARLNSPDRDQTITQRLMELCKQFLADYPESSWATEVTTLQAEAKNLLAQHELHIMQHYVTQKKYASAARRFEYFIDQFSDVEAQYQTTAQVIGQELEELTGLSPSQLIEQQAEKVHQELLHT